MTVRTWAVALVTAAAIGSALPSAARGQDNPTPEQMKKMYGEAVAQLKAAQERKNQLAAENEKLGQQLEATRKDLAAANGRLDELRRADAEQAEKTYFLRAHYTAWQQFVALSPDTDARWRAFLSNDYLATAGRDPTGVFDRAWPIPPGVPVPTPATNPTTAPAAATLPATGAAPTTFPATSPASVPATQVAPLPPAGTQPSRIAPGATQPTTLPTTRPA